MIMWKEKSVTFEVNNLLRNNPLWIVDVGASGGIHARWGNLTSCLKCILFEPDLKEYEKLLNKNNDQIIINAALSDKVKNIDFNICKKQEVSSVYMPNYDLINKFPDTKDYPRDRYDILKKIEIKTDTLSNQLKLNDISEVDFIKIDVQGYGLSVLKGSVGNLSNTIGLEVEVEFLEIYKNQPLFNEVDAFIQKHNFELFDIKRYFWKRNDYEGTGNQKGQLVMGDALYLKNPEQIMKIPDINTNKIIRSICIYLCYGYIDLAQTLLKYSFEEKLINNQINEKIKFLITLCKRANLTPLPYFKGKGRIGNIFKKISDLLKDDGPYTGTDQNLGN